MTTHTSTTTDLSLDVPVAAPAERLRAAIVRVGDWWTTHLDRSGSEFTAHFDENWTRMRVDGDQWTVTAQHSPALPVPDEWLGDSLTFEVEQTGTDSSVLHFTHHGLLAQRCAAECQPAWQHYLASLVALAETGQGNPWQPGMEPTGE